MVGGHLLGSCSVLLVPVALYSWTREHRKEDCTCRRRTAATSCLPERPGERFYDLSEVKARSSDGSRREGARGAQTKGRNEETSSCRTQQNDYWLRFATAYDRRETQ